MARKDPDAPPNPVGAAPNHAPRLQALYEECLSAFEAERTTLPLGERMQRLQGLMRLASALAHTARAEHQARTAADRADAQARRTERMFERAGLGSHPGEGDEMDMNDQSGGEDGFGDLEQVRQYIDERFGWIARRLEASPSLRRS